MPCRCKDRNDRDGQYEKFEESNLHQSHLSPNEREGPYVLNLIGLGSTLVHVPCVQVCRRAEVSTWPMPRSSAKFDASHYIRNSGLISPELNGQEFLETRGSLSSWINSG